MKRTVGGSSAGQAEERAAQHEPLVHHVVAETMRRVPASVTPEELTAAGLAALAEASRAFEPDADGDFHRFASTRVRAALVDTLRAIDWDARGRRAHTRVSPARLGDLRDALAGLPDDGRAVVEGYFLNQRPLADLATDLQLDEHEAARLRTDALHALRRTLGPAPARDAQSRPVSSWSSPGSSGTGSQRILNLR